MKMNSVILIGFLPNPRIYKRIALEKEIYNVHLICWNRESGMLSEPIENGFKSHCISIPAVNDPVRRLVPYKQFSIKVRKLLKKLNPAVIHVQGLDMLEIAYKYKKETKRKLHIIYEVADIHRLLIDNQKSLVNKMAQIYLKKVEKKYCSAIDLLIITSEKYNDIYFSNFIPQDKVFYFPNVPDLSAFSNYVAKDRRGEFTVGYIGSVRYKKQMHNLVTAVEKLNIQLLIAGFETEPIEIEQRCKQYSKGEWIGNFKFSERASDLYGRCDVMYSVYNANMENVRVALPNKLYESIYCGIPLIVAKNTYLAEVVNDLGVGIAVDHNIPDELIKALDKLYNDRDYYRHIQNNCKKCRNRINLKYYNDKLREKLLLFENN